jgi:hypothetical protein
MTELKEKAVKEVEAPFPPLEPAAAAAAAAAASMLAPCLYSARSLWNLVQSCAATSR